MTLTCGEGRQVDQRICDYCGQPHGRIRSMLYRDGEPHAFAIVACYDHGGEREAWIDVIFGSFDDGAADRITFGCRVGPVEGQAEPAATAVHAAEPYDNDPSFWGRKLRREQALAHERLADFWSVVDWMLLFDPEVHEHVYGHRLEFGTPGD